MKLGTTTAAVLLLIFANSVFGYYAGDFSEFEWKKTDKEATHPKIVGRWIGPSGNYRFYRDGTFVSDNSKGMWRESTTGGIYAIFDWQTGKTFSCIGYVEGNKFSRDHLCYSYDFKRNLTRWSSESR